MEILSYIGTLFTAFASIPQLYKTCTKSDSVASGSSVLRILAAVVWGSWAVVKQEWVFLVSCSIVLLVEILILIYRQTTAQ